MAERIELAPGEAKLTKNDDRPDSYYVARATNGGKVGALWLSGAHVEALAAQFTEAVKQRKAAAKAAKAG